jgi:uncharacterized membrane protein
MYDIQPLYGPGTIIPGEADTYPFGINSQGDVTGVNYAVLGDSQTGPEYTEMGAIWRDAKLVFTQPWNAENDSCLYSINGSGVAVGVRATDNSPTQLADYVRGVLVYDLGPAVGQGSIATHVNEPGLATGWSWSAVDSFIYDTNINKVVASIPPLPGTSHSYASAINSAGQVVGASDDNGFFFAGGALKDLGPVGFVTKINDASMACGSIGKPYPQAYVPVIWDTTQPSPTPIQLPVPGGFIGGHADGINIHGDVVGSCWPAGSIDTNQSAYIYSGGFSTDLNGLIEVAGWHLDYATAINDAGQITGYGTYLGQQVGFLLTPRQIRWWPRPRPHSFTVPELVGTLLGGVAVDAGGWLIVAGHHVPVDPWGPFLSMDAAKRDALIALALDEVATYITEAKARETVRRALIQVAQGQIENLAKLAGEGRSFPGQAAHPVQASLPARATRLLQPMKRGKNLSALRRLGIKS